MGNFKAKRRHYPHINKDELLASNFHVDPSTWKIDIESPDVDSPAQKVLRIAGEENQPSDPNRKARKLFADTDEDFDPQLDLMVSYMRNVRDELKKVGRLDDFITFIRLTSEKQLDLENIAVETFFDVVRFTALKNIKSMRFSPSVKNFWLLAHQMFHGKFLRFMGGYKSLNSDFHHRSPKDSLINFVVPCDNVLKEEREKFKIDCNNPGIILSNIERSLNVQIRHLSDCTKFPSTGKRSLVVLERHTEMLTSEGMSLHPLWKNGDVDWNENYSLAKMPRCYLVKTQKSMLLNSKGTTVINFLQ